MAGVAVAVAGAGAAGPGPCASTVDSIRDVYVFIYLYGVFRCCISPYIPFTRSMALQLCAVSRSLELCIKIRLRLEYRPANHLATLAENNSSSKTHSLACSRWCVSYGVVCDLKIKSGRRMTHTCSTETYMMHTRCRVRHTRACTVLPYGRRVMLSDHQPGRGIS